MHPWGLAPHANTGAQPCKPAATRRATVCDRRCRRRGCPVGAAVAPCASWAFHTPAACCSLLQAASHDPGAPHTGREVARLTAAAAGAAAAAGHVPCGDAWNGCDAARRGAWRAPSLILGADLDAVVARLARERRAMCVVRDRAFDLPHARTVSYAVLRRVVLCCDALYYVATWCTMLRRVVLCCDVLYYVATRYPVQADRV